MARKEQITKENLLNQAFELLREEGMNQVTARKLAGRASCSTQPIFRLYKNMEELHEELYQRLILFFEEYYISFACKEDTPFVHLGLAYIQFAQDEKYIFEALFLSKNRFGKSLYELLNGSTGSLVKEINKVTSAGCDEAGVIFMKMWILIHGAACMVVTGDYDLSERDTISLLKDCYYAYMK